jgi:hypothetical protein
MTQVVTFQGYKPVPRYDGLPWTQVRIEESATEDGTYTPVETISLSPVDTDPTDPAYRNFTTEDAGDGELWYQVVFVDANGDESSPTDPVQNVDPAVVEMFASVSELLAILNVRAASTAQSQKAERCLMAAAGEIRDELDLADGQELDAFDAALCSQVNLARGAELWKEEETQFGILGVGSEVGTTYIARDTWDKHAIKLSRLKGQWGIA